MWNLLKVNIRDCVSLLKTCHMSKTSVSLFLVYYEHFFVYCDAFVFKISFLICLSSILNRPWSSFSVISLRLVLSHLQGWVKVNKITERSSQKKFWKVLARGRSCHQRIILKITGKGQKQPPDIFYKKGCC